MDQLRIVLSWLKREHFWVLLVVMSGLALGSWYSAASDLSATFTKNKSAIQSEFSAQTSRRNQPFHPNNEVNKQQLLEINKQAKDVQDYWQQLYDRQQTEVLQWPKDLPKSFLRPVKRMKFGDKINSRNRDHYLNYAKKHFVELPKIVQARVMKEGKRGSRKQGMLGEMGMMGSMGQGGSRGRRGSNHGRGGVQEEEEEDYLVEWLDQWRVREELIWEETPSHWEIWVTQEDLWVYHTLLRIIADTNRAANADRSSNAAVRIIESLEIGQAAAQSRRDTGRITLLTPQNRAGGMEGGYGMEGMGGGYGMEGGMSGMGGMESGMGGMGGMEGGFGGMMGRGGATGEGQERTQLLSGRYLDKNNMPIPVTETPSGDHEFGLEYKRLPIRMSLLMDQRWITHLIAECANAPLQIEVQEVRISPSDGTRKRSRGGRGMMGGMGGEMMGGMGGGGYGRAGKNLGQVITFNPQPNIMPVIIQGTIYIFNEPESLSLQPDQPLAVNDQ